MIVSVVTGLCLASQIPNFQPVWRTGGLGNPESIIADGEGGFIVSNVNGEAAERNGAGYLARLDAQGQLTDPAWVSGLDAPKGLALMDGRVFVSDIDQVVEIDAASGHILARHFLEGAGFLNDVSAHGGRIYVSDSARGRIHAYEDGRWTVWLEDERLGGVNGLLPESERMLIATMSAGTVLSANWQAEAVLELADGFDNADGIARVTRDGYLVSQWPGEVWYWSPRHGRTPIFDERDSGIFMNDILVSGNLLLVPHWSTNEVSAWRIDCSQTGRAPRLAGQ